MMKSLGHSRSGKKPERSDLPVFLEAKNIEPYVYKELEEGATSLIFQTDKGHTTMLLPFVDDEKEE